MATLQDIQRAGTVTPIGSDSLDYMIHKEWRERELVRLINDRELLVYTYSFIAPGPQPREVFACDHNNRTTDHSLDLDLRPLLENRMTDRTFNNRIGYGPDAAINQVIEDVYKASEGFTRDCWIIKYDLTGYFPNANRQHAYDQLSEVIEQDFHGTEERKDDLRYLLRQAVLSDPLARCEIRSSDEERKKIAPHKSIFNKPPGIGGCIGRLIWQNGMNYYLNDLDHWAIDDMHLLYTRFVDDTTIVTTNKEVVLSMMPEIRRRLAEHGCQMHPKKFYCQHYTKGFEFLGKHVKIDRVYVNNRILHRARVKIRQFNHCIRPGKIQQMLSSINSYLGQCKNCNGYGEMMKLIGLIDPAWWEFIQFNEKRRCLQAKPEYSFRNMQNKRYHIKPKKHHDTSRKRTAAAAA